MPQVFFFAAGVASFKPARHSYQHTQLHDSAVAPNDTAMSAEVLVCANHWCKSRGAEAALAAFVGLLPEKYAFPESNQTVVLKQVGCMGACEKGPNIRVATATATYEINKVYTKP